MEEEDNYEEGGDITNNPGSSAPLNNYHSEGQTHERNHDASMTKSTHNSYDQAIEMGYVPTITAVPPLISSEDLDRELFAILDSQNTG
jgi:hypothetical protein